MSYPVTATLSVPAIQVSVKVVAVIAEEARLLGALGTVVSARVVTAKALLILDTLPAVSLALTVKL